MASNQVKWNQTFYTKKLRLHFDLASGNKNETARKSCPARLPGFLYAARTSFVPQGFPAVLRSLRYLQFLCIIVPFSGIWVLFEGKNFPVAVVFIKRGRLEGEGVHKGVFAAARPRFVLRGRKKPPADPLPPERFADEKIADAQPVSEGLPGQSGKLPPAPSSR